MARVAANQDRSEALCKQYVYKQHIHILTHKPGGKLMREETADYNVVPTSDGTSVVPSGIPVPFMFLGSGEGDFSSNAEIRQIEADIKSVYDRLPPNGRLRISIRGANHFTFSDDGALLRSHAFRWVLRRLGKLGIDGPRQLAVTSYCIRSFFDAYLKDMKASQPTISSSLYPEVQVVE